MSQLKQVSDAFASFITKIFVKRTSTFITIYGRRGSGKTDFALLIAEILFYMGAVKHICTNIKIYDSKDIPIEHVTNLDDLKYWAKSNRGRKLFLFDEIGVTMKRRTPMSGLNVKLITEFQLLRKYMLSVIAITIDARFTDNAILGSEILDGSFMKPELEDEKKSQKLALYVNAITKEIKPFHGVPPTSIEFETYFPAVFTEHGEKKAPIFKEKWKKLLWDWSHGTTINDLDISRTSFLRIKKKFIREVLERDVSK